MKNQGICKAVVIIEIIVLYLSFLNVVSHARGPVPYTVDTENPLVQAEAFSPFFDMGVTGKEGELPIFNTTQGVGAGYQAELELDTLGEFQVAFSVDCPAQYAGSVLVVDLYNLEENYDVIEQEEQVVLQTGLNEIVVQLSPGEVHPKQAQLRIFTTDVASYTIEGLHVSKLIALNRVTTLMIAVPVVLVFVLCGTIFYQMKQNKAYTT